MMIFVFFNDTATTEIYTLSLHDALPISRRQPAPGRGPLLGPRGARAGPRRGHRGRGDPDRHARRRRLRGVPDRQRPPVRSEEHTSELQSRQYLVCRLLLEKKNKNMSITV